MNERSMNIQEGHGHEPESEQQSQHQPRGLRGPRHVQIDGKEYVSLPTAAKTLKIAHMTMYKWATNQVVGDGKPLDVYQDPMSKHRFISLEEVQRLANRFRRSGTSDNVGRGSLQGGASKTSPTVKSQARRQPKRRSK
jgi:hypothetical protein